MKLCLGMEYRLLLIQMSRLFIFVFCFSISFVNGQSVGIGTINPEKDAFLHIASSTKGVLIPRITEKQRLRITNPADGLLVYQTDGLYGFRYWDDKSKEWTLLYRILDKPDVIRFVADESIVTELMADQSVRTQDLADQSISLDHIPDSAFTSQKLATATLRGDKISNVSLGLEKFKAPVGTSPGDLLVWSKSQNKWNAVSFDALSGFKYIGFWNARLNIPDVRNRVSENGDFFIVKNGSNGVRYLDDLYEVGDLLIRVSDDWQKIQGGRSVTSVFGRSGDVLPQAGDYAWEDLRREPNGKLSSSSIFNIANVGTNTSLNNATIAWSQASKRWEMTPDYGSASRPITTNGIENQAITSSAIKDSTLIDTDFFKGAVTEQDLEDKAIINRVFADKSISASHLSGVGANDGNVIAYDSVAKQWGYSNLLTPLNFQGVWDANTNTPNLTDANAKIFGVISGEFYVVGKPGTVNFNNPSNTSGPFDPSVNDTAYTFKEGDWAIYSEGMWVRVETLYPINAIYGRTGAVNAQSGDYTWAQLTGGLPVDSIGDVHVAMPMQDQVWAWNSLSTSFEPYDDFGTNALPISQRDQILADAIHGQTHMRDSAITNPKLAARSIENRHVKDDQIQTPHIKAASVIGSNIGLKEIKEPNIAKGSIVSAQLGDSIVVSSKFANQGINEASISSNAVENHHIQNAHIKNRHIKSDIFTTAFIRDMAIEGRMVKDETLDSTLFDDLSVTGEKFLKDHLTSDVVKDNTIRTSNLSDSMIQASNIEMGVFTSAHIIDGSVSEPHMVDSIFEMTNIDNNTIDSSTVDGIEGKDLLALSISNIKLVDASLDGGRLPASVNIGGATPHPHAVLAVESTTKGFLPPRSTINSFEGLDRQDVGLMIYDTNIKTLVVWNGSRWVRIGQKSCNNPNQPCPNTTANWTSATTGDFIDYNGLTYGVIRYNNKFWLDRNLGAARRATSKTDAQARGHFYQWGRQTDGHQLSNSAVTFSKLLTTGTSSNLFVSASGNWAVGHSTTLWSGSAAAHNPCPPTWRVPTLEDFKTLDFSNSTEAFNGLFVTLGGQRSIFGLLEDQNTEAHFWAGDVSSLSPQDEAIYLHVNGSGSEFVRTRIKEKTHGLSVRCVKD